MAVFRKYELQFFTATILEWKKLLRPNKYKDFIIDSFRFLVKEERVIIHAFVIMDNHLHLLWHIRYPHKTAAVQRDLLKFTAQRIKFDLLENHPDILDYFKVAAKDRMYQFWERNALSVDIATEAVLLQKLRYIHENPVKAGMAGNPVEYWYSSARFYETGLDDWQFLSVFYPGHVSLVTTPTTAKTAIVDVITNNNIIVQSKFLTIIQIPCWRTNPFVCLTRRYKPMLLSFHQHQVYRAFSDAATTG